MGSRGVKRAAVASVLAREQLAPDLARYPYCYKHALYPCEPPMMMMRPNPAGAFCF